MVDWIDLIVRKRESEGLEPEEIMSFVEAVEREEIASDQAAAFLMAVTLNGFDEDETGAYVKALTASSQSLRFSEGGPSVVDVGETAALGNNAPIAALPIAAVYGCKIPVVGDRALGTYGGLMDKFEAIPGFRGDVSLSEFQEAVENIGIALVGQTTDLAPADTLINRIRTKTGSSGGGALAAASLLARKAVAGVRGLAIQIYCGSGGIAKTQNEGHNLADLIFGVGENLGMKITGVLVNGGSPVGHAIGDSLEIAEAIEVLKGDGPEDLREVVLSLAGSLLTISQLATDHAQGVKLAEEAIADGRALTKFKDLVSNQGGDAQTIDNLEQLPRGQGTRDVTTQRPGHIKVIDCNSLGRAWRYLGGSRDERGETTDHRVGLVVHKKVGDAVQAGEQLVTLHTSERSRVEEALEAVEEAFLISPDPVEKQRTVLDYIGRHR